MILMISLTIYLPQFDQRRILPTPQNEYTFYTSKIIHMLHSIPSNRFLDYIDDSRLIIIPEDTSERYNAFHHIDNEQMIRFIASTLPSKKVYQQEIKDYEIIGPFSFKNDPNVYYLITNALPQSYYLSRVYDAPLLLFILMLVISFPFAAVLSWSLMIPMKNLVQAVIRVSKGDWREDRYLEMQGPTEYRQLAKHFNQMITTLKRAQDERTRLFANLSHEMRTPITRIQLANSLIRLKNISEIDEEVQRINDNIRLLEDRIQSLLSLSKQMILNPEQFKEISLLDLLWPLLEDASFEAKERGKQLNFNEIPDIKITANLELISSGIENIVRNAIHYAKSKIEVTMSSTERYFIINVHDDGPGVLEKDLPQIFEPFYRGERPTDFEDYGGSGLGLAIVTRLVESHRGKVEAINDHGLSITITLPVHPIHYQLDN
ncbi:ATP-binding protein [Ignatzschineria sp. F8392]|uniref:ATP-binding protein n=1 Tax=Ignatzschineria sp. F8392 TaxID=1980117 RepID=UPI00130366BC|nr:ATP-binding protein [Ignatzschineria sp. F8392]